jgi:hypothetical protein
VPYRKYSSYKYPVKSALQRFVVWSWRANQRVHFGQCPWYPTPSCMWIQSRHVWGLCMRRYSNLCKHSTCTVYVQVCKLSHLICFFNQSINQSFTVWTTAKPELKSSASRRCSLIQLTCDAEHESDRSEGTSFAAFIFLKHSLSCLYNYYVIRFPENKKVMCGNIPWVCFASWHSFFSVW